MESRKLVSDGDHEDWINSIRLEGENAKRCIKQVTIPSSYPVIVVWHWVEDHYSKDWLHYAYVYPSDF